MAKINWLCPQNIFIADDTIASNIAFGIDDENIDYDQVQKVAKIANIHNFINNDLPKKYLTTVGERGVRLSRWRATAYRNCESTLS